ncbi:MAG TPA: CRISPR-associated protein [Candidatus Margulisbacteria bacterium]|nr:MAG: CRISPR-associated protein [Bacteroidetes bacterium GWF2_43_11]OGI10361.1 MAG: CRISPR-associated protein [Candidatus Margulisbacteria bacterium GWE2_39_32]HCT86211.1 CRISPR-associated protein [Candidatus Margulisiibacteriota bacterium]
MGEIIKRATGLLILEVVNSNPNGDPDRESDPRQRSNRLGEISPVSFKRKLRELVEDVHGVVFKAVSKDLSLDDSEFKILESRDRVLIEINKELSTDIKKFNQNDFLNSKFVKKYWDARLFGNTFLEKGGHKGYIKTGVAQFVMGLSVASVNMVRHSNTKKAAVEEGKSSGMAPLAYRVVEHGVYCMPFYINPSNAHKSGCTVKDIELLKVLIPYAYDHTRSAIRPDVRIRHAWYMEHKNALGSCADYKLIEALTPIRKGDDNEIPISPNMTPSTSWSDYSVPTGLPNDLRDKLFSCVDLMENI